MKKVFFIIGIMLSLSVMYANAEQTRAEVYRWNHELIMNGRERTPARLPIIEIVHDSDSQSVRIISSLDWSSN